MMELILACAPMVAPQTIQEVIRVESSGNPIAVNVNTKNGVTFKYTKPRTRQEAIAVARAAIAAGHTVDMGYMQVNSFHLKPMNYSIEEMFDPCRNIQAGAHVVTLAYFAALKLYGNEQGALRAALSAYNTGNFSSGFQNGYVAKYTGYAPAIKKKENNHAADTIVFTRNPQRILNTEFFVNRIDH